MKSEAFFPEIPADFKIPFIVNHIGSAQEQCHIIQKNGAFADQIIYGKSGEGILNVEGKEYKIEPNTCFFLPKNVPHEYYPTSKWRTNWISFSGTCVAETLECLELNKVTVLHLTDVTKLEVLFKSIFNALKSDKLYGLYSSSPYVYELLIEFKRYIVETNEPQFRKSNSLLPILNYIDDNIAEQFTLEQLAQILDITPQYLCRLFKDGMGVRPFEYITKQRIQTAKKYLADRSIKITEIAKLIGFQDTSYFCLMFKRYEGITPTEFRKLNQRSL